jgi:hypothetical protein
MQYILAMTMVAAGATAQVRLPAIPLPALPQQTLPQTLDQVQSQSLDRLSALRHLEIGRLIRGNPRIVDTDPNGEPVVRNEILALAPTDAALVHARSLGFIADREQTIGAMNFRLTVFRAPPGMSTKKALRTLREADPGGSYDYNHIYSGGGTAGGAPFQARGDTAEPTVQDAPAQARVRMVYGPGVDATRPVFRESLIRAWGCAITRFPPLTHAVESCWSGARVSHGVPGAELYAADVLCRPPAERWDTLVAAFLGCVVQESPGHQRQFGRSEERHAGESGRSNRRRLHRRRVGNEGRPPPLLSRLPSSTRRVTAVDAHRHVLIEARGPQVMFACPRILAAGSDHAYAAVRGTFVCRAFFRCCWPQHSRSTRTRGRRHRCACKDRRRLVRRADLTYGFDRRRIIESIQGR